MDSRYARQTALGGFGEESLRLLADSRVLVVGAGGVGSALLPLLAGAGVGRIDVADFDSVSVSNLHRQTLYTQAQVGLPKAREAAQRLAMINSEICVCAVEKKLSCPADISPLLDGVDLCLDATDSFASRIMISDACAAANVREIACCAGGFKSQMFVLGGGLKFSDFACDADAAGEGSRGLPIFGPAAHLSGVWGAGYALQVLAKARAFEAGYIRSFDFSTDKYMSVRLA